MPWVQALKKKERKEGRKEGRKKGRKKERKERKKERKKERQTKLGRTNNVYNIVSLPVNMKYLCFSFISFIRIL